MVGEVLSDRYEVEELVGTGGMSSVFRARDRLLDREVALKVLHQQYGADAEYVERFRREARAVAALSHPNIVTVIDRGEHEGRQFIVFEYVAGENLKHLIQRRGPAPVATALELSIQIARALSFAHRAGLVHRDVKPQNVLLNGDGQAKVTDFGIARSLDVKQGMTQTGTVLGTSAYIAPEQAQGQRVDEHTDVYSLGVVLFELLTGEVPFAGDNFVAVAMRHINEPPPPVHNQRPDVPPRVEAAVLRAMAKDPADRFETMADFCAELESCLAELQSTQILPGRALPRRRRERRVRKPRSRPHMSPLALLLVGLLCAAAVAGYAIVHSSGGGTPGSGGSASAPITGTVPLQGVTAYDPFGDPPGQEHNAEAPKATDSDPNSYWETELYHSTFAQLGKPGVGLVLDAGSAVQLHRLGIATSTPGFTAEIKAGDSAAGPFPDVVSAPRTAGSQTIFTISGGKHRYYVVWITQLPAGYQFVHINDVSAN